MFMAVKYMPTIVAAMLLHCVAWLATSYGNKRRGVIGCKRIKMRTRMGGKKNPYQVYE